MANSRRFFVFFENEVAERHASLDVRGESTLCPDGSNVVHCLKRHRFVEGRCDDFPHGRGTVSARFYDTSWYYVDALADPRSKNKTAKWFKSTFKFISDDFVSDWKCWGFPLKKKTKLHIQEWAQKVVAVHNDSRVEAVKFELTGSSKVSLGDDMRIDEIIFEPEDQSCTLCTGAFCAIEQDEKYPGKVVLTRILSDEILGPYTPPNGMIAKVTDQAVFILTNVTCRPEEGSFLVMHPRESIITRESHLDTTSKPGSAQVSEAGDISSGSMQPDLIPNVDEYWDRIIQKRDAFWEEHRIKQAENQVRLSRWALELDLKNMRHLKRKLERQSQDTDQPTSNRKRKQSAILEGASDTTITSTDRSSTFEPATDTPIKQSGMTAKRSRMLSRSEDGTDDDTIDQEDDEEGSLILEEGMEILNEAMGYSRSLYREMEAMVEDMEAQGAK